MELKKLFDEESNVVFDRKLLKKLLTFRAEYLIMYDQRVNHPAFYGGHYIGTYPVRFYDNHRSEVVAEIFDVDALYTKRKLDKIDGIEPSFKVQSDLLNQLLTWAAHKFNVSKDLNESEREEGMIVCFQIMHYRFLGSLSQHYFGKYVGKEEIDAATYAALSRKFFLKQEGSWSGVIARRCNDIIDPEGIHGDVFDSYDSIDGANGAIQDIQTRIREQWKGIYAIYIKMMEEGQRVKSTSLSAEIEGESVFMDKSTYQDEYLQYARKVSGDRTSFVKHELMEAISREFPRLPLGPYEETLRFLNENYLGRDKRIAELVDAVIIHMFEYVGSDKAKARSIRDIGTLIAQLKGVYTSPKSKDPNLLEMREEFERYAKKVTRIKTQAVIASIRTGVMLYIVLRTLTKKHYSQ